MNQAKPQSTLRQNKKFLFDPHVLNEVRKKSVGMPIEESFQYIIDELDRLYPGHICKKTNWIFNNAGGAMGQLTLLHASIREYIILFGTCVGTEGHSGRYASEVFDFVIKGTIMNEYEGRFTPEVNTPESDEPLFLEKKVVKHYRIEKEAWMLEYSRGNIVKMFPFGTFDSIFSTLDVRTVARLVVQYGKLVIKGLFTKGKDLGAIVKFLLFIGAVACAAVAVSRALS